MAKRTAEQQRNTQIVELYCQGKDQGTIGKIFGLSQGRVSSIVQQARDEWAARREIASEDHVNLSLMKLDEVYREARLGWERSYQDAVTLTTKKSLRTPKVSKKNLDKARAKLVTTNLDEVRKGQAGDPAFLQVMKNVVDTKLKLLNAFPREEKTEVNNVVQINWNDLANPIVSVEPLDKTPSSAIEERIAAELPPPSNNGNGHV